VYDHDYPHLRRGKAIPHGIYDMKLNEGYLSLGKSHETAEFVVDNLQSGGGKNMASMSIQTRAAS